MTRSQSFTQEARVPLGGIETTRGGSRAAKSPGARDLVLRLSPHSSGRSWGLGLRLPAPPFHPLGAGLSSRSGKRSRWRAGAPMSDRSRERGVSAWGAGGARRRKTGSWARAGVGGKRGGREMMGGEAVRAGPRRGGEQKAGGRAEKVAWAGRGRTVWACSSGGEVPGERKPLLLPAHPLL